MKALILYAGKHGATGEIAQRIADKIEGSVVFNLKDGSIPPIAGFDCIVIGSAVYAGTVCKEAKEFISRNEAALCGKKLGLYLSGMDSGNEKMYFDNNFSQNVLSAAIVKSFLGGIFDPKKAGLMGRIIMKAVAKKSGYLSDIHDDRIEQFAEVLKA